MKREDFSIGIEFYTGAGKWRCTDVGSRVVVAIRIDRMMVCSSEGAGSPVTKTDVFNPDPSWFNGPPYKVAEHVFDEYALGGCSLDPREVGYEAA